MPTKLTAAAVWLALFGLAALWASGLAAGRLDASASVKARWIAPLTAEVPDEKLSAEPHFLPSPFHSPRSPSSPLRSAREKPTAVKKPLRLYNRNVAFLL